jgi:hypothetical protein
VHVVWAMRSVRSTCENIRMCMALCLGVGGWHGLGQPVWGR